MKTVKSSGQMNVQKGSAVESSMAFADMFPDVNAELVSTSDFVTTNGTPFPIPKGSISVIRGLFIEVLTGTVTFKHDSNGTGIQMSGGFGVQGILTLPELSTTDAEATGNYTIFGDK